ncbi:MAG: endolytic transglycosylase MltG [Candidatus Latescibacteria bacterium]|nr:endolytic transglycosylase MltG [Candidatus Latescibacterota bacterium]
MKNSKESLWERMKDGMIFIVSFLYIVVSTLFIAILALVYHLTLLPFRIVVALIHSRHPWTIGLASVGAGLLLIFATFLFLNSPTGLREDRDIVIRSGLTARGIGRLLRDERIVRSERLFALLASVEGIDRKIEVGRYRFNGRSSTFVIVRDFMKRALTVNVTIPEGLTIRAIAGILSQEAGLDSARFVALAKSPAMARRYRMNAPTLEGYLFPDTYNVFVGCDEEAMIEKMMRRFHQVVGGDLMRRAQALGLTIHEVITLASIIEKEAQVAQERPVISSVFHKRLFIRKPLESCVTVEYALGQHKARLSAEDIKIDSPYNTYKYSGLPPGPIANPGRASILAALYPLPNTDYLYFVAKGDGTHIFSRSQEEHIAAVTMLKRNGRL